MKSIKSIENETQYIVGQNICSYFNDANYIYNPNNNSFYSLPNEFQNNAYYKITPNHKILAVTLNPIKADEEIYITYVYVQYPNKIYPKQVQHNQRGISTDLLSLC